MIYFMFHFSWKSHKFPVISIFLPVGFAALCSPAQDLNGMPTKGYPRRVLIYT